MRLSTFIVIIILITVLPSPYHTYADLAQGVDLAALQGWDIVIDDAVIPSETYAAHEFQHHVQQATGVRLPIKTKITHSNQHIFISTGKLMRESSAGFSIDHFGPEDLRIIIRQNNIAIAGGRPRGTLYGVYTFLEDYLGIRFLTADHTHVPSIGKQQVVGPVDRFYHPPLEMRKNDSYDVTTNPAFSVRHRINTETDDPQFGGRTLMRLINHSFYKMIPWSKYGKEHPEYFALINGERKGNDKRDGWGNELCLTNPDVLRIITHNVLDQLEKNPHLGNISVSQNDYSKYHLYCRCPKCSAINEREGTPMGSLLTFVNAVADAVAEKYPHVKVGTLSYQYSRKPPKTIKPRPNVQIQLCSIQCCVLHPINDPECEKNVAFCRDLDNWKKICDNIYIWNYNANFSHYQIPCPNLRVIEPNIRYFVDNHAKGVFMEAARNTPAAELADLRNYIINSLLWDPTRNGEQLKNEFLELHYGPAANLIHRYIEMLHDRAEAGGKHPNTGGRASRFGLNSDDAQAGLDIFAEAIALAGDNEVIRARLEKLSICAYRVAIEPVWYIHKVENLDPDLAKRMKPLVKRFFELCDKYGVTHSTPHEMLDVPRKRIETILGISNNNERKSAKERQVKRKKQRGSRQPLPPADFAAISYGNHPHQKLDLWLAKFQKPTPLLIHFHGGGFAGPSGSRKSLNRKLLEECLKAGISVATADYRVTQEATLPLPMHDAARAIQFLRYHADKYKIDPHKIAAHGGSGGGGISLWLAYHDDLADPMSDDPMIRQSSRITCAVVQGAQPSYDPRFIARLFSNRDLWSDQDGLERLCRFYGLTEDEIKTDKAFKLYEEASPITHLSADDPPVFMFYRVPNCPVAKSTPREIWVHHPLFAKPLIQKAKTLDLEVIVKLAKDYPANAQPTVMTDLVAFLTKHFNASNRLTSAPQVD